MIAEQEVPSLLLNMPF